MGVPLSEVFSSLEISLGSAFVNESNYLGRTFRVTARVRFYVCEIRNNVYFDLSLKMTSNPLSTEELFNCRNRNLKSSYSSLTS